MKFGYCKKRMGGRVVYSTAGAFHPDCLDKLHATAEAFGQFMFTFDRWNRKGQPEGGKARVVDSLQKMAGPLGGYLKQLAANIRAKER